MNTVQSNCALLTIIYQLNKKVESLGENIDNKNTKISSNLKIPRLGSRINATAVLVVVSPIGVATVLDKTHPVIKTNQHL